MPLWDSPPSGAQFPNGPGVHSARAVCIAGLPFVEVAPQRAEERPMKITVTLAKPRNPLVAAARQRLAGAHRRSTGGQRQRAALALRRELQHERHPQT